MFTSEHFCTAECQLVNERFRRVPGCPVQMMGPYAINLDAYNIAVRGHPKILSEDSKGSFVDFIRIMTRILFHHDELLRCNMEGCRGLEPLCPQRLEVMMTYVRHHFPVSLDRSLRGVGKMPSVAQVINTVLRQRRNDHQKKIKAQQ